MKRNCLSDSAKLVTSIESTDRLTLKLSSHPLILFICTLWWHFTWVICVWFNEDHTFVWVLWHSLALNIINSCSFQVTYDVPLSLFQEIVIDGKGHLLGRLAATVAKAVLQGKKVVVVRCEQLIMSGNFFRWLNLHFLPIFGSGCHLSWFNWRYLLQG